MPEGGRKEVWSFLPDFGAGLDGACVDELFGFLFPAIGNRGKRGQRQALMAALLMLAQAADFGELKGALCGFIHKRSTSRVSEPDRYRVCDFSTTQFTKALDALVAIEFAECWKGFKGADSPKGVASLWLPTRSLKSWLFEHSEDVMAVTLRESGETIVLKDGDKRLQDYVDEALTLAMRERVDAANSLRFLYAWSYVPMIDKQSYLESDERRAIPTSSLRCYRVFSGDFRSGGRFYCGAQGLRKGERATITVDGKPTVELDYKSLHPRLLYNAEGIAAPEDCYSSGSRPRELTKLVSLLSINCDSFRQAHRALMRNAQLNSDEAREHLETYAEEHPEISHRFFQSDWKRLQYLDSQIVDAVLTKAVALEIPILPVHDSFIVATEHAFWVMEAAAESYRELTGFDAVIDWEPMPDIEALLVAAS
ncbi:hypothetical protein [Marinobacter sediminum]|uniref:hypothetical protein n=1 Tax=Marinobacter sediminum TaxID=256323 RepID=UPI00193A1A2D|nr:hypothetical protein [Marinobacter sediminum]